MNKNNGNSPLALLTASAMTLPGVSTEAATPTPTTKVEVSVSQYQEDDIDRDNTFSLDRERYEIDVGQFYLLAPVGENHEVSLNVAHEKMSGASPWFVLSGFDGEAIQVMSGATIADRRNDVSLAWKTYSETTAVQVSAGLSDEDDYRSRNLGLGFDVEFGQSTLSVGGGYSRDKIEPTDSDVFLSRVEREDKYMQSVFASITHILSETTVLQTGVSYERQWGYLSDPYKLTAVAGIPLQDSRPESRHSFLWQLGVRQYFRGPDAALQFDYRYFNDSWGIRSHTMELAWHQNLPAGWSLRPSVRHYSQTEASFFGNSFSSSPDDGHFSSDYRLSGFGAWTYGLSLAKQFSRYRFELAASRYRSDADDSVFDVKEASPGLVNFSLVSLTLAMEFD